jgi:hypothetical protein
MVAKWLPYLEAPPALVEGSTVFRFFVGGRCACFALLVLPLLGCGAGSREKLHPVSGRITINGKPLTLGSVAFRPMKEKGNTSSLDPGGEIEEDGTYIVFTQNGEGAPAGWWKVIVSARDPIDPKDPYKATRSYVPAKYELLEKTDLAIEVQESPPPGAYDLQLTGKP